MARYIDLDKAIPTAIQACVDVVGHGITQVDAVNIALKFEEIATADVAPKSEDDEIVSAAAKFTLAEQEARYKALMAEHDREVAREIFEEIDKIRLREIKRCETMREMEYTHLQRNYWEGGEHSLRQLSYWIAELKKKYTEVRKE